jgi:hypothetical protein
MEPRQRGCPKSQVRQKFYHSRRTRFVTNQISPQYIIARFGTHCSESERTELRDQSSSHLVVEVGRYSAPEGNSGQNNENLPRTPRARR